MTPYYDDGQITIYCGDCREVLPTLGRESVDLIVTDPPYGVRYVSGFREQAHEPIAGDESTEIGEAVIPLALDALKDGRHAYVFSRWDVEAWPVSASVELIWDRGKPGMGDLALPWGTAHEPITFMVKRKSKRHRESNKGALAARLRKGSILRHQRTDCDDHPTQKPVSLIRELIESSSCFGDVILDPFMGAGSTLVAARLEGRRAIGIELEERYCEIAVRRLQQAVLPLEIPA